MSGKWNGPEKRWRWLEKPSLFKTINRCIHLWSAVGRMSRRVDQCHLFSTSRCYIHLDEHLNSNQQLYMAPKCCRLKVWNRHFFSAGCLVPFGSRTTLHLTFLVIIHEISESGFGNISCGNVVINGQLTAMLKHLQLDDISQHLMWY